jgi:hypothetical protein
MLMLLLAETDMAGVRPVELAVPASGPETEPKEAT